SKRMLLLGNAGMGKSCFSKEFMRTWAEGKNDHYKCIIYLMFQELNSIEQDISIKELLERKCKSLFSVLKLKNPDELLIILDGLDEFKYDLDLDNRPSGSDVDTPFHISVLVSKLIARDLLPDADVMVTAPWNFLNKLEKYFTCVFVLKGFDDQQIKQYFDHFLEDSNQSQKIYDFIKNNNISDFASVPLYSFILHQIIKNLVTFENSLKNLNTCSQFLTHFLKTCLGNILKARKNFCVDATVDSVKEENLETFVKQLGELSYRSRLCGQLTAKVADLKKCGLSEEKLTEYFSYFFCKKHSNGNSFEYLHPTVQEMFAAFYCACVVRDDELRECLNAWVRGIVPQNVESKLLFGVTADYKLQLENFTRLFMGFLSIGSYSSLHSDTATLKGTTREILIKWFQDWLREFPPDNCLKLLHYIFELQDFDVAKRVSECINHINLCNKPLGAMDVKALHFSLKESKLKELDLRLCELEDKDVKQLKDILVNFTTRTLLIFDRINVQACCSNVGTICSKKTVILDLTLRSNKLNEESGKILSEVLQTPECVIEVL
uniref:NACHT domain-containing protein n=1 Tax=Latimeria chalumnae TaxID=7897 RepID=H3AM29_LATCH